MAPSLADAKPGQVVAIVTEADWEEVLKREVVLVDFTATWCGPCRMMSPLFEKAAGDFAGITFVKVDVDEAKEVAAKAGVSAMPTFQVYVNGKMEEELVGAAPDKLQAMIAKYHKA